MIVYTPLIEKALRRAAEAHRDQTRKASDLPYLTHPVAVMLLLVQTGYENDELLAAALLHDVVEDTPVSLEQLQLEFPRQVCQWVAEMSEKKKDSSGEQRSWEDRKRDHLRVVQTASEGACAITLADKLHNMKSMLYDLKEEGTIVWDRFNAPPARIVWYQEQMLEAARRDEALNRKLHAACQEALLQLKSHVPAQNG